MPTPLTRTDVCRLLGVSQKSLYLWERNGLIPSPKRDRRNWRSYSPRDVAAIRRFLGDSVPEPETTTRRRAAPRDDRLSARNQLAGTIVSLKKSGLMCEVVVRLGDGQEIAAIITVASADRLGLKKGSEATAVMKATEVIIMR